MVFALESPAFDEGQKIPRKYSRGGENISPPLVWKGAPAGTKSFVLVMEDPDAPAKTFRHWGLYNIAPERSALPEAFTAGVRTESIGWGVNGFGEAQYDGPQPPKGHGVHHYHFRLAALDVDTLHLGSRARVEEIWKEARPHILAEAELIGTFENP